MGAGYHTPAVIVKGKRSKYPRSGGRLATIAVGEGLRPSQQAKASNHRYRSHPLQQGKAYKHRTRKRLETHCSRKSSATISAGEYLHPPFPEQANVVKGLATIAVGKFLRSSQQENTCNHRSRNKPPTIAVENPLQPSQQRNACKIRSRKDTCDPPL